MTADFKSCGTTPDSKDVLKVQQREKAGWSITEKGCGDEIEQATC